MSGQVVLPFGMLVPLLHGTTAGDQCLERLGIQVPGPDDGTVLEQLTRSVDPTVAGVLAEVRGGVGRADRCVQVSSESGSLRAVLVFSRADATDHAVVAFGTDGLHAAVLGPAELEALLVEAVESSGDGDLHASLWAEGAARAALTV